MNKIKAEYFFPLLLIALDVGAASVYAFIGKRKPITDASMKWYKFMAILMIALFIILIGSEIVCV